MNAMKRMALAVAAACVAGPVTAQVATPEREGVTQGRYEQLEERVRVLEAEAAAGAGAGGRSGDEGGGAFRFSGRPEWQRPDLWMWP